MSSDTKLDPIVPIVSPEGVFKEPRLGNRQPSAYGGESPFWFDKRRNAVSFTAEAEAAGWVLYEDLCRGRYTPVNGGEPVAMPEKWEMWKRVAADRKPNHDGRNTVRIRDLPDDFYHPEVYARREAFERAGGARVISFAEKYGGESRQKRGGKK